MGDSPLDRNLERLLRRGLRPAPPDAEFRERLLEKLQSDAEARSRSARRAPRWLWPSLAAALAAGMLIWIAMRPRTTEPIESVPDEAVAGGAQPETRARLLGRLIDAKGNPVPATIYGGSGPPRWGLWSRTLDGDGRFVVEDLPAGKFALWVWRDSAPYVVYLESVEIAPGAKEVREEIVLPAGVLSGAVVDARTGRPIPGAPIVIVGREEIWEGENMFAFAWADEEGRFRVEGLGTRDYRAMAYASGYGQEASEEVFLPDGGWKVVQDLALSPGGSATLLVVDPAGQPVDGGTVQFFDSSGEPVTLAHLEPFLDAEGRIEIPGAKPGRYTAKVWREGALFAEGAFEVALGKNTETTIRSKGPE
jgi:hypothetical protein